MSDDWKTLRVPTDAWERAKEQKESAGRTWGEQIVRPDGEYSDDGDATAVDADELADALADRIDYPESQDSETIARRLESLATIEERTGRIERTLEDLGGGR